MHTRTKVSALLAAGSLIMAIASVAFAAPPSYSLTVEKTANPASVPVSGGSVEFTVAVTATGTGFFQAFAIDDGMAGCTLAGPFGDVGSDGKLSPGETWTWTCTVANVLPDTTNTATVNGCHDTGSCSSGDATGADSVTVGLGVGEPSEPPASEPPASEPPASEPPASEPAESDEPSFTGDEGGVGGEASEPATNTLPESSPEGRELNPLFLVASLALLFASIIVLSPEPARRRR